RITTNYKNGRLILHNVTNFADMQTHDGNWLREMTVGWKVNDQMTVSAGRLLLSGGMSAAGQSNLETIVYPASYPFNRYAYGVQGVWSSERWTIMGDVSGKSGLSFLDEASFDAVEASTFIQRKFQSGSAINLTAQLSQDFRWYGLGGTCPLNENKTVKLRGELYYADNHNNQTSNMTGGYGLVTWQATKWLELCGQVDHRQYLAKDWQDQTETRKSSGGGLTTFLVGASAKVGENVTLRSNIGFPTDWNGSGFDPTFRGLVQVQF
ncbi:MAG: hypothetical protein NT041_00855, partial [Candidatus Vogelbacteria bacterium]|nr:hypothetical protein [Candidatus Vogelbacteria bacterium]